MATTVFSKFRLVKSSSDILIIGGGVIGLTTAWNLAREGVSVTVVDKATTGREASWAGAGMLPPGVLANATTPEARLRAYSHQLWDGISEDLSSRTGIDNGYRRCGSVELAEPNRPEEYQQQVNAWNREGITVESLDRTALETHVPDLHPDICNGVFLPQFGQIRNPRHLKSLSAACQSLGVEIIENCEQLQLTTCSQGWVAASAGSRKFSFDRICIAAGAWTAELLDKLGFQIPVKPIRGQMAQLQVSPMMFARVIEQGRRYIVPRADGLLLVGSTMEVAGFEKKTTADGMSSLLEFAKSIVPELGPCEVVRCWAGLRPGSPDELPFLGRVPNFENLFIGAGHFRCGLQMSPGSGAILTDLLMDRKPVIDLTGLRADRQPESWPESLQAV